MRRFSNLFHWAKQIFQSGLRGARPLARQTQSAKHTLRDCMLGSNRLLLFRYPEPSTSFKIACLGQADSFCIAHPSHSVSRTGLINVVGNSNPSRTSSRADPLPLPCVSRAADPSMSQRDPLGIVSRTDPFKIVRRVDRFSASLTH